MALCRRRPVRPEKFAALLALTCHGEFRQRGKSARLSCPICKTVPAALQDHAPGVQNIGSDYVKNADRSQKMQSNQKPVAETEGFEPSVPDLPVRRFSKPLVSATHPRLRIAAARGRYNEGCGGRQGVRRQKSSALWIGRNCAGSCALACFGLDSSPVHCRAPSVGFW